LVSGQELTFAACIKIRWMRDYEINVTHIEELQTIKDLDALDRIFERAYKAVVGGAAVILLRHNGKGKGEKFDELTTENDLATYRERVYKYL